MRTLKDFTDKKIGRSSRSYQATRPLNCIEKIEFFIKVQNVLYQFESIKLIGIKELKRMRVAEIEELILRYLDIIAKLPKRTKIRRHKADKYKCKI